MQVALYKHQYSFYYVGAIHALQSHVIDLKLTFVTQDYTQLLCACVRARAFLALVWPDDAAEWNSRRIIHVEIYLFNDTQYACLTRRVKLCELSGPGMLRSPARQGAVRSRPMFIPVRILLCHRPLADLRLRQQRRSHALFWWPVFTKLALIMTLYREFNN